MTLPVLCFLLFMVTVTSGFLLEPGHGLMCRQCDVAIHPSACMKTGRCMKDQECYTETYTASDSTQLYRLGCISAHICRISVQSTTNDTECFSCCQTNNCNTNLCPSSTCRKPYYGPICTDVCGHCVNHDQCNQITGRCPNGCESAHVPPYCRSTSPKVCSKPFYGTYCTETCGHCSSGEQCDKETGRCLNGCDSGFVAPYCNSVCPRHSYGPDCRYICGKCAGGDTCDHQNGLCRNGCETGFLPPLCSEILSGRDCADIKKKFNTTTSGIYEVTTSMNQKQKVWCDMTTDGEGWIVVQRRTNDSVQFDRTWAEYKKGFGYINGSFWWGNDNLASFTSNEKSVLRIDMEDEKGQRNYTEYQGFYVEHEDAHYKLHLGNFHGNVRDSMSYNSGMNFSTKDQDNDNYGGHCAQTFHSGWWFNSCSNVHLNGIYGAGYANWYDGRTFKALTWVEMKFRSP